MAQERATPQQTAAQEEKRMLPLREGLFRLPSSPGEEAHLIGSRCRRCGETFHPKRVYCAHCSSPDMEEITLSTRGTLHTYTIVRQTLPGSAVIAPYAIGRVRLPEGVTVQTVIIDCDPETLKIGMPMEMFIRKVKEDEAGNDLVSFFFRPVQSQT